MDKRIKIVLLVLLGIIIISLLFYFLFFYNPQADINSNTSDPDVNTGGVLNLERPINLENGAVIINKQVVKYDTRTPEEDLQMKLTNRARLIAERFGSFSNHSDYENIKDLEIYMTPKMKGWADDYIADNRTDSVGLEGYYGITTKALSGKMVNLDEAAAEVMVSTQRIESREESSEDKILYQDISVEFVKTGEDWMVDGVYWQQ